ESTSQPRLPLSTPALPGAWLEPGHDSERPALAALVELHVLETLAATGLAEPEVELAHVVVAAQLGGRTVEDDPAVLHDVAIIRDAQGHLRVLLDEQERRPPLLVDLAAEVEDLAPH